MSKGFKDLKIWQKAYELALRVRKLTSKYPKEERFGLIDQTNRSSASVMALIAEAHGRYFYKDKSRVLYEARGEVEETRSHLFLGLGLNYITEVECEDLSNEYDGLGSGINAYIKSFTDGK